MKARNAACARRLNQSRCQGNGGDLRRDPVFREILPQLFRAGKQDRLPAAGLRASDIGRAVVDEEAGRRLEIEGPGVGLVDRCIRLDQPDARAETVTPRGACRKSYMVCAWANVSSPKLVSMVTS